MDAVDEFAIGGVARDDTEVTAEIGVGALSRVQTELRILILRVRAVALETLVRDDRPDLVIERYFRGCFDGEEEGGTNRKLAKGPGHGRRTRPGGVHGSLGEYNDG